MSTLTTNLSEQANLAILCGGHSRRLGTDKGLYAPQGDESLIVRQLRLLADSFQEILIVVKDPEQVNHYQCHLARALSGALLAKCRVIADSDCALHYHDAPLAGVLTALSASVSPHLIVMPVDQLGIRRQHLARLQNASHYDKPCAFGANENDDELFPFPARWPKSLTNELRDLIAAGSMSVRRALAQFQTNILSDHDYAEELSINANTIDDFQNYFGRPLFDATQRRLHYLRFSLIESCNMACTYCLPDGYPEWYRHKARMGAEDIKNVLRGFRQLGFRKVRFTGGEPTLHPKAFESVRMARKMGYEQISLTTNGLLISNLKEWYEAGLTSLNISLDSLNAEVFKKITKSGEHQRVLALVDDAVSLGLETKINTVLLRSMNGGEADALIDWALQKKLTLRFIELMPTDLNSDFSDRERVLGSEIAPKLFARGMQARSLNGAERIDLEGPATIFDHPDLPGRIGLINPLSCNFCASCNRLRVTAKGGLRLCLFGNSDLSLPLATPEGIGDFVRAAMSFKKEKHGLLERDWGNVATFRTIGG